MRNFIIILCLLFLTPNIFAKSNKQSVVITYQSSFNGVVDSSSYTLLEISGDMARITPSASPYKDLPLVTTYINFADTSILQTTTLREGKVITTQSHFIYNNKWEYLDDTEKVAGINCKKAKIIINSNTIEIFYFNDTELWGTPSPRFGVTQGIVLKTVMNGTRVLEAVNIEYSKKPLEIRPVSFGEMVESNVFQKMINDNSTIVVDVFKNQRICFDTSIESPSDISQMQADSVYRFANGTIVLKKVSLPDSAWNYSIFAELSQYSDGDAYDRTGNVFVIPTNSDITYLDGLLKGVETLPYFETKNGVKHYGKISTDNYTVPVELVRFFTGFGTRKYNHIKYGDYQWNDFVIYKQDVSAYSSLLTKEAWIGVYIGNYDKGGHIIDLKLSYHPNYGGESMNVLPLFCTLNIMEMAGQNYSDFFDTDTLKVEFDIDQNVEDVVLSYISTGHGGWGGGDEFNRKPNTIFIDDAKTVYTPWRCDCASNREKNPCSGNSTNGLTSSDYSRSGWCPGTITNPIEFYHGAMERGRHTILVTIPQGAREGNSFSSWNISGVLLY